MSLPSIPIPANPPSPSSTADSSDAPRTPGEISNELGSNTNNNKASRKPSRRANTAERRATHNAVERQRRETLNGRFLDLAALLPNLSQIRRPSKSSIVNSSIAHIHASRRHRVLASRELRLLKMESDALRRELNEWRDRAGIPRVEEPQRGDGFGIVLSGELEVIVPAGGIMEEDEEEGGLMTAYDAPAPAPLSSSPYDSPPPFEHPAQYSRPSSVQMGYATAAPMIASPTGMAFENPQQGYYGHAGASQPVNVPSVVSVEDKWLYAQQQQQRRDFGGMMGPGAYGGMY